MATARQSIEIFHLLFLRYLEEKLDKSLYALKGGCNLRFFFNSIRYSEDIDLDIQTIAKETLRNKINKLLELPAFHKHLKVHGMEIIQIVEAKQSSTTQRWKCMIKSENMTLHLPTKIEFSRRGMDPHYSFESIDATIVQSYQLYPIFTNHYSVESALTQKINALAFRSQTQARDAFDLHLLLNKSKDSKKCSIEKSNIETAKEQLQSLTFSDFLGQVVSFLLPEFQNHFRNEDVWNKMKSEIFSALETIQS